MKNIIISDLHFGEKNNSPIHNQDLKDFFLYLNDWNEDNLESEGRLIIGGDVFHHRDKIDVSTINSAVEAFDSLRFSNIISLKGNHDLYYRDRRDIHSLVILEDMVDVIDFYETEDGLMFCSWILNAEEYDEIIKVSKKKKIETIIGHFEFSTFAMNDHYVMEHGLTHRSLKHVDRIFSGHYHMRQNKDNVCYIGSPFPFDFNDANDSERGFVVFDDDTLDFEFVNYEKVGVVSCSWKDFLDDEVEIDTENKDTSVRIVVDEILDESTEEELQNKLREAGFREVKVKYKVNRLNEVVQTESDFKEFESIDSAIVNHLKAIEEKGVDNNLLIDLFRNATRK